MVQQQDETALARHIEWKDALPGGPVVYYHSHPELKAGAKSPEGDAPVSDPVLPAPLEDFEPFDVVTPAKVYLLQQLHQHLHDAAGKVQVGMAWDARRAQPAVSYVCPTLLSMVWLQFATVVNEGLVFNRCPECGTWFEVAPGAARTSRQYCSTGCRSKAYRERQDRARRMHTEGMSFEAIAEALGSDAATVKRWITGTKDEG